MTEDFNKWWDSDAVTRDASCGRWDADNIPKNNPYSVDTPVYWAWEGWQAGVDAEREACAKVCDDLPVPPYVSDNDAHIWDLTCVDCAEAIRERGAP